MAIEMCLEDLEINRGTNTLYNKETGEIIEDKEVIINLLKKVSKDKQVDNAKVKEIRRMFDLEEKKEKYWLNWKEDSHFIKIYRTELREYMQTIKLSPDEGLFLFCIQTYVEFQTNRIAKPDGTSFSNKELQELTKLGRDKIKGLLKTLEDKLFIKRVGQRQAREIYFNPYLICSGNEVSKATVNLFKDAGYRPITPY
ncbi:hypothetical protein [Anaerosalibacter massiliensis]|uniref:hypothetical protein n=1 Tax=Anaerosalibacter massiliensis TaxID=1347392 RepID=UPI0005B2D56E|nr:hypothetical protein [Anaerosalibacter massiliensis]